MSFFLDAIYSYYCKKQTKKNKTEDEAVLVSKEQYGRFLLKSFAKKVFNFFYTPLDFFLSKIYIVYYRKKIQKIPKNEDLILIARHDFGTLLLQVLHAKIWNAKRNKAHIVVLSSSYPIIESIVQEICPELDVIYPPKLLSRLILFISFNKNFFFNYVTLDKAYRFVLSMRPDAVFLYKRLDESKRASLRSYLDLECFYKTHMEFKKYNISISESDYFYKAYADYRKYLEIVHEYYLDFIHLYHNEIQNICYPKKLEDRLEKLKQVLGIDKPYVVININTKKYPPPSLSARTIVHTDRYLPAIGFLIKKGFNVILQGREEQPIYEKREGLIDYSKSNQCSVVNDMLLYFGASFAIISSSGPDAFALMFNKPVLGINYTEPIHIFPYKKFRFYLKPMKNKMDQKNLSWKEFLKSPGIFQLGSRYFCKNIEFEEMTKDEILDAVKEFLPMLSKKDSEWENYTSLQSEFKKHLTPMHMDLYYIKGVPCDCYLKNRM